MNEDSRLPVAGRAGTIADPCHREMFHVYDQAVFEEAQASNLRHFSLNSGDNPTLAVCANNPWSYCD